jgi:hypothetical protein
VDLLMAAAIVIATLVAVTVFVVVLVWAAIKLS